ncbi:hypothetical protein LTR84_000674 [Exophiala bonariae]|uniref:AB hydrolase-1 domain-containing protein n=1 Tax=Exophiala bonariae TaxID=1690606 RepID=A0AAV9NRT3_9EURO|nr:hypothetical protein LTR84_000674 [Exophiala bonariae]
MKQTEGSVDFPCAAAGKDCQIWYMCAGDIRSGRPLVILHGGPGMSHDYLLSLTDLASPTRPLIFFDQIGTGKSTHLPEKRCDYDFWTEQFFLDQVTAVVTLLGIQDDYDLLGQSWGGMLAAAYAATQPAGLRRLVLANTPFSSKMWTDTYKRYRDLMPEELRKQLMQTRTFDTTPTPEYQEALDEFYKRHFMNLDPLPAEIQRCYDDLGRDDTVWKSTLGPDEFDWVGTMATWTMEGRAHLIKVRTLLMNGAQEGADDLSQSEFKKFVDADWVKFDKSTHMPHWEERDKFMRTVSEFLNA